MNVYEKIDRDLVCDVFRAYYDARTHKRNTHNQLAFEINFEENLFELAAEIQNGTYRVGRSVCFIVENPVKREIFAADFRDRVVHHLIYNYINDIFENRLIRDCYSCRKGFGTSDGVERIRHHMRSVTDNFTRQAYVLKLDIQGYFMSIRRDEIFNKVHKVLSEPKYRDSPRIALVLRLLREVVFNDPTVNCERRGSPENWNGLPASKSLFSSTDGCGLPIGNLTSQMFSNIFLSDFDNWVKRELKVKHYGRYVDDFFLMHTDKEFLIKAKESVTVYLWQNCGLKVHPNKIYLQDISHGVTFLGTHVKPHRCYMRTRTLGTIRNRLQRVDRRLEQLAEIEPTELLRYQCLINSHLGYMKQFMTFGLRKKMWKDSPGMRKHFTIDASFRKIKPRHKPSPESYGFAPDPPAELPLDLFFEEY